MKPRAVIPMRAFDKVRFHDGQHGTIAHVLKAPDGPAYLLKTESGAVFTVKHSEVRRVR